MSDQESSAATAASSDARDAANVYALTPSEQQHLERDGYVVRSNVFTPAEIAEITDACEQLVRDVLDGRRRRRIAAGAYVFEPDLERGISIKWEGDSDVVHGIEPCVHLSPTLAKWAVDARFVVPMRAFVGHATPTLFTEKLNLKRPQHGGVNPLHQDYPYWVEVTDAAANVGTAMLFLDDASANGTLEVAPGSHRLGAGQRRNDRDPFGNFELDPAAYADLALVPVEVPAGSVVYFGAFLVHKSEPNRSALQRRALLFSYQPPGHRTLLQSLQAAAAQRADARRAAAATSTP